MRSKYIVKPSDKKIKASWANAELHKAIANLGYASMNRFSSDIGLSSSLLYKYLTRAESPMTQEGEFRDSAKMIMAELCVLPQEIWSTEDLNPWFPWRHFDVDQDITDNDSPYNCFLNSEILLKLHEFAETLPRQQKRTFCLRVFNDLTLDETAKYMVVTRECVRQNEVKANDKLRLFCRNTKMQLAYL